MKNKNIDEIIEVQKTINNAIKTAFNLGDKDECYIKHIGHTLSAIYVGNGYKNVVDYSTPGCSNTNSDEMDKCWMEVENACNKIGKEKFKRIAQHNPDTIYFFDGYIRQAEAYKTKR